MLESAIAYLNAAGVQTFAKNVVQPGIEGAAILVYGAIIRTAVDGSQSFAFRDAMPVPTPEVEPA